MSDKALASIETGEIVKVSQSQQLMAAIVGATTNPAVDPSKMREMYTLYTDIEDRQAKKEFYADKSALEGELPILPKNGRAHKEAPFVKYEEALAIMQPYLLKYGFSYACPLSMDQGQIKATGTLSHRAGHSTTTEMYLPADTSGSKNAIQAVGSSSTYGKRYCLFSLVNVAASGDDDDGAASGGPVFEGLYHRLMQHNEALRDNIESVLVIKTALFNDDYSTAYEAFHEVEEETMKALWVAPTKGGIFTTEERNKMKGNEWFAASQEFHKTGEQE